jgi:hypothetical protein
MPENSGYDLLPECGLYDSFPINPTTGHGGGTTLSTRSEQSQATTRGTVSVLPPVVFRTTPLAI